MMDNFVRFYTFVLKYVTQRDYFGFGIGIWDLDLIISSDSDCESLSSSYLYLSVLALKCVREIPTGSNENQIGRYIASLTNIFLPRVVALFFYLI